MKRTLQSNLSPKKQKKINGFFFANGPTKQIVSESLDEVKGKLKSDNQQSKKQIESVPDMEQKNLGTGKRKFQLSWLKDFTWLEYEDGIARCKVCNLFPNLSDSNSRIVQGYSSNFKSETLKKHANSQQHRRCEEAHDAKEKPCDTPMAKCIKSIDQKTFAHLTSLFNACYYLAKNNRPFSDFKELVVLLSKCDVTNSEKYANEKKCQEFVTEIAEHLQEQFITELKNCKYLSILMDASTDKSDEEQLIIYVRYLVGTEIKESFLTLVPLENCTADGYIQAIMTEFSRLGLENLLYSKNLIGIGTDGAATMIGINNGVATKLSEKLNHLVSIHCAAHKLQLSVLQSCKDVKIINEIDSILITLYKFYMNSPKRLRELKVVSEALELKFVKILYVHKIRWVASKVGTIKAVIRDWKVLTVHLESATQAKGADGNTAKGLLKKLRDFRFLITLHFLCDYLIIFKELSLVFQRPNFLLSQTKVHVQRALKSLENLKTTPATYEESLLNEVSLEGVFKGVQLSDVTDKKFCVDKTNLIEAGKEFLKARFINIKNEIVAATAIFDTFSWPEGKKLQDFGESEIELLSRHFASCLDITEDDVCKILDEWYEFKVLGKNLALDSLFERCVSMKDRFPHLTNLLSIVLTLPVSTSSCERGFSTMNTIKNKLRSNLRQESLNSLMLINLNGPSLTDFNPEKSIDKWYFKAKTQRHC